jgi:hypothetical protein
MAARHGLIRFAQGCALDPAGAGPILLPPLRSGRRTKVLIHVRLPKLREFWQPVRREMRTFVRLIASRSVLRVLAVSLFARLAKRVEAFEFTFEQCFFLRTRPPLELSLAGSGSRKCLEFFDPKERDGWVELSCSTGLAGRVIV